MQVLVTERRNCSKNGDSMKALFCDSIFSIALKDLVFLLFVFLVVGEREFAEAG